MKMTLTDIAKVTGGQLIGADADIYSVSIDTRTLQPGDLYIGIKGHQFDGNTYVNTAEQAGAKAALLSKGFTTALPHILVDDTRLALAQFAGAWRDQLPLKVVGITGSNGKTTVKEMVAAILGVAGSTLFTKGNLNNDIGVPLTLLRLSEHYQYAVIEMGANHANEIAYTSAITKADVVILNNAGAAHIEGFGSLDGVAKAKGEIIETLKKEGTAVLNRDDKYFAYWLSVAAQRHVITFGIHQIADISARDIKTEVINDAFVTAFELINPQGTLRIHLKLAGKHNVMNALAASAAALSLGLSLEQIKSGLETMQPVTGRMQPLIGELGNLIIDDTYNANADSLKVGLDVLLHCEGKPWVVLGAFGELGNESPKIHEEIGQELISKGVVRLLAIGSDAEYSVNRFGKGATFFNHQDELIATLKSELTGDEVILIKGSRTQRMENVAAALVPNYRK